MAESIPTLLVLAALVDGALLYGMLLGRRRHQRKVEERLHASARLYGLIRVALADRRTT